MAKLADRSFLDLWSYPNVFIDKKLGGKGVGKELCDLLVVCGDHVVIFSDKTIAWPQSSSLDTSWTRWFKRAVGRSAQQIRGAERWIRDFPDRIFIDPECTQKLPIALPPRERRKVHGIVVARGAAGAARQYFGGGIGSMMIRPSLHGVDHANPKAPEYAPFNIGDVDPGGAFIHVFDGPMLDIVMQELDTITDFTAYLEKKAAFVRSGRLLIGDGEEHLLAWYLTRMNENQEHDFTHPEGRPWRPGEAVVLEGGHFEEMIKNPQYRAKKEADQISYVWDRLIEAFTKHMLAGTTLTPDDEPFNLSNHEQGVRYMALEPRFQRRLHGEAIMGALEEGKSKARFVRAMLPGPSAKNRDTGFFFLTFEYPTDPELPGGYDQYRKVRTSTLYAYALGLANRHRFLKRIVGIATEPPAKNGNKHGSSEDLILFEARQWTPALEAEAQRAVDHYGIMKEGRFMERGISGREYPEVDDDDADAAGDDVPFAAPFTSYAPRPNRKQRRAFMARARKAGSRG